MAEKRSSGATFESIMKDMKVRKFSPVYLLMGDEPYFIDKISDYISDNAIKPEERDFNQMTLYGLDTSPSQIMDAAHAAPMMSEYQVIIVREAQLLKNIEQLEKYLKSPIASTILVLCYKKEAPKSRKGWIGEAERNGVFFESKKLRDYQLPGFINGHLRAKGVSIEEKACMMLADYIGADLSRVVSELDKLFLTLPQGETRITPQLVEEQIGISKDFNVFELRDAIIKKDVVKANRIAKYFYNNPQSGNLHSIVPQLFNFFQNLMLAFYCPNRLNGEELSAWLGLRGGWAARDYITAMNVYNAMKTMQVIQKLRTVAAKSNGLDNRSASERELMQELIYFILH
ncbi:MAG: DNA polymerase III subunit delta [Bacteroidales bacterium]|nr:DNA polymerase III subunit delta [Bacteroidales bacterium]MCM1148195.1 DNA polymerase III subunit delta [Bacteroidales bacterium]MCM1207078.1 DNA polymerase III subunit delta [Bacillota bacterium]MCM1510822.1 DNA polymerase III subunit delta [Clostridium sp.]